MMLTSEEVADLTGARRRASQFAWLRANGYPVEEGADGRPKVLRAAVEAKLMPKGAVRAERKTEPDLSGLRHGKAA
jgi:hypothetical protein